MEEWPTKRTPHHTIQLGRLGDSSREGDSNSVPQNSLCMVASIRRDQLRRARAEEIKSYVSIDVFPLLPSYTLVLLHPLLRSEVTVVERQMARRRERYKEKHSTKGEDNDQKVNRSA